MSVKISPIKILSDLGFEMVDIETDKDYLSALREGINTIEAATKGSGDRRSEALREELIRVRREKKADPKFNLRIKKTTVSPKKIMGQKMLPPAKLDSKKLSPQGGGGDTLSQILVSVTSIRDILVNQIKQKRDDAKKKRRATENVKRKDKESGLEILKKGFGAVKSGAEKIIAPVKSLFKEVLEFIGKVVFGRVLFKLFEWFTDKKNQDKVKAIGKFLKKTWPVLLAAYLLFGNAFGRMAVKLGVMITKFSIRLVKKIIPALVKAIAKMKLGKLLKKIPGFSGGGIVKGYNEGGMVDGEKGVDKVPAMLTEGEFVMSKGAVEKYGVDTMESMNAAAGGTNKPTIMRGYNEGGKATSMSMEDLVAAAGPSLMAFMEQHNALIDSDPEFFGEHMRIEMDRDGKMLNFGKTVANMSEWAFNAGVEQIQNNEAIEPEVKEAILKKMAWVRRGTLQNPNFTADMAFDINKEIPGTAANRLFLKAQADTTSPAAMAGMSARDRALAMNRRGMFGGGLVQGFKGGGRVYSQEEANAMAQSFDNRPMAQIQKLKNERSSLDRGPDGKLSRKDKKRWNEISAEIQAIQKQIISSQKSTTTPTVTPKKLRSRSGGLFGGLFGGGNKGGGGSSGILGPIGNVDDMVNKDKYKAPPKIDAVKKEGGGGSSGILGPISSNIGDMVNKDKYKVQPPVKKSVVQAYEEEKSKIVALGGGGGNTVSKSKGGNDLPNIDAAEKRSVHKIKTLGISV